MAWLLRNDFVWSRAHMGGAPTLPTNMYPHARGKDTAEAIEVVANFRLAWGIFGYDVGRQALQVVLTVVRSITELNKTESII